MRESGVRLRVEVVFLILMVGFLVGDPLGGTSKETWGIWGPCSALGAWAPSLEEKSFEAITQEKNPVLARKILMDQAMERMAEEVIRDILGDGSFQRNRLIIQKQIISQWARYIPYSKAGDLREEGELKKMTVVAKVQRKEILSLLKGLGLLDRSEGPPPLVGFSVNRAGDGNLGNSGGSGGLRGLGSSGNSAGGRPYEAQEQEVVRILEAQMQTTLGKQGIKLIRINPGLVGKEDVDLGTGTGGTGVGVGVGGGGGGGAEAEPERSIASSDPLSHSVPKVVVGGTVALLKNHLPSLGQSSVLLVRLEILQRIESEKGVWEKIGDLSQECEVKGSVRNYNFFKEVATDLSQEVGTSVVEAWQGGRLVTNRFSLSIEGGLLPLQQENLAEALKSKFPETRRVELLGMTSDRVSFNVYSNIRPYDFFRRYPMVNVDGLHLEGVSRSPSSREVNYRIRRND